MARAVTVILQFGWSNIPDTQEDTPPSTRQFAESLHKTGALITHCIWEQFIPRYVDSTFFVSTSHFFPNASRNHRERNGISMDHFFDAFVDFCTRLVPPSNCCCPSGTLYSGA